MNSILLPFVLMIASQAADGRRVPDTADGIFTEAVGHWGSSTSDAALVTIVDARSRREQMACVEVDSLGQAVALEHGMKWWPGHMDHVTERMRSQHDRRFVFKNESSLRELGNDHGYRDFDEQLCKVIRQNKYAFRGDRPSTLYVGRLHDQ